MSLKLPKIGDPAPAVKGKDQNGKTIELAQLKGKKVVIYFYPKDDTPGCTAQACNLRDNYADLKKEGYEILGVSVDNEKSHVKFMNKYDIPFPLIADTDHAWVNAFGVWGKKKFMGREYDGTHRVTFILDEQGRIQRIIQKPNTKEHAEEILA